MHISLVTADGKNAFIRDTPDPSPLYPDIAHLSDLGRHFLAGLLVGLPDIMPILAPTINSYKRLVEFLGTGHSLLGTGAPGRVNPSNHSTDG